MKRFWLVMLSLGLVLAFSASAMAVDVKFSGSFYAAGMYLDKTSLTKGTSTSDISTAFYYQRLRLQTDFIVSPGLKLVTRFDAMERAWGAPRSATGTTLDTNPGAEDKVLSSGTRAENQNIAFDLAYIEYASPIGLFSVGYQQNGSWGTVFNNYGENGQGTGTIKYILPIGPLILGAAVFKEAEGNQTAINYAGPQYVDKDHDKYVAFGIYNFKGGSVAGEAGLLYSFNRLASYKPDPGVGAGGVMMYLHTLQPYAKVKVGPVAIEGEFDYYFGKKWQYETVTGQDSKIEQYGLYLNAVADFGMFYAGGTFAYVSGDKDTPGTSDTVEGGIVSGGIDWNPTLIMWNYDRTYWAGSLGANGGYTDSSMSNAFFYQVKGGVRPIPVLDLGLSVAYAYADQLPKTVLNKTYGWEVDVTGTYKITNNLSYMLGVGYFFTGDYYKGTSSANQLRDDYILINKLTLTF